MRRLMLALTFLPAFAFAEASNITHETLDNGLNIYIKVVKRSPVVLTQVWYKVGGSYEHNGITGISHLLEHLMFSGTAKYPNDTLFKTIASLGGTNNAGTAADYTVYYETTPTSALPQVFNLEADRMHNITFSKASFKRELSVVKNEKKMRMDNVPSARLLQLFNAQTFLSNPYHHMTIGWQNDLDHMTLADAQAWYHRFYQPNNATLVVVGDVKPEHVIALAKQYFGPLKPHTVLEPKPRLGQTHFAFRQTTLQLPIEQREFLMGFNVPNYAHFQKKWQAYALVVLAQALAGNSSAILPSELVRKMKTAVAVSSYYNPFSLHNSAFIISAVPAENMSSPELVKQIETQLEILKHKPLSTKQLQRIKIQIRAQKSYALDSLEQQAEEIGLLASINLPIDLSEHFADHVDQVTAAQVQAVAKQYIRFNAVSLAYLEPLPKEKA
ncbi:MAG: peptidase M16 [Gammaproteobacteria bacterium CG11_big_fil_rev_8_21_14_0_20_46_22]|nr:MAG: peptidase M16 [Gammaproteobacteria bacterium CG12_big_fil_rev_8_21_14_0_65_46_12]PIR10291.1 MAG: peptidase M16 [Gammaproteobacteria bacterium CG11_big_fil_rev_8_21_14_0_20_46_22]